LTRRRAFLWEHGGMDLVVRLPAAVRSSNAVAGLGLAGGILMAASSYWVAAIPIWFRRGDVPVIEWFAISSIGPRLVFYAGLVMLFVAWLALGRQLLDGGLDWRAVRTIGLRWLVPIALAAPLFSRDLWAYAAQGHLVQHGLDPYSLGPSALPGVFSEEVSERWVSTPAPYGPLWLLLGKIVAIVMGNHVTPTVYVLRGLTVIGLLLLTWAVPILAERAGGRADVALWLTLANPLFLLLGVGGGHNDLLMVGLMALGLVLATNQGPLWRTLGLSAVAIAAATAIKSPAVIAAAFAVPLWLVHSDPPPRWRTPRGIALACVVTAAVAVATFAIITALSGLGLGWVKQVNNAAPIITWMSIPTSLAMVWKLVHGTVHGATRLDARMREFRSAGTVATLAVLAVTWWWAFRSARWPALAVALLAVVLLGPTVQPWYFCWALAVAAAFLVDARSLTIIGGLSVALVAMIRPNGTGFQMKPVVIVFLAAGLGLAWLIMRPDRARVEA
jgi:alpha-1,6-mannosyltransferase